MTAEQWLQLKTACKTNALGLWMPCCKVPAVPKTSTRGNFFFAHARRGECTTADESPEHLYCKSLVAKAAHDAGWVVTTERLGASPDGEAWVADVFCEKGTAQLALEVQMSAQTDAETVRRQKRYQASGVRGAWFFGARRRQGVDAFGRDTPAFSLRPVTVGELPMVDPFEVSLSLHTTTQYLFLGNVSRRCTRTCAGAKAFARCAESFLMRWILSPLTPPTESAFKSS